MKQIKAFANYYEKINTFPAFSFFNLGLLS